VTQATSVVIAYLDPGSDDSGSKIVAFVIAFLVVLVVLLLVIFLIRRANSRPCPRCGSRRRTGRMRCEACGFDFDHRPAVVRIGRGRASARGGSRARFLCSCRSPRRCVSSWVGDSPVWATKLVRWRPAILGLRE
jgi:hypothetical protein